VNGPNGARPPTSICQTDGYYEEVSAEISGEAYRGSGRGYARYLYGARASGPTMRSGIAGPMCSRLCHAATWAAHKR
jgi:hypothetical protein